MPGNAVHRIFSDLFPFLFGKNELHKGLHGQVRELALQLCPDLFVGGGTRLAVECENDRIEDCGLSCTGIAPNQENILRRLREIDLRLPAV